MSVEIGWTRIAGVSMRPVLVSGNQEGPLGGWSLPVPRIGDRFAADIKTAQFRQDDQRRLFIADIFEATTADARIAIYQPDMAGEPSHGAPLVTGGGQSGSTLNLDGMTPNIQLQRGRFFNIIHGGVRYTHMIRQPTFVSESGTIALPIWPMLRFLTVDNEGCDFDAPMIEGQLSGDVAGAMSRNRGEPVSFSIQERG